MSTAKLTFASILGLVTVAANAATQAVNVAANGIDMLDNTVDQMKQKQRHENAVDLVFSNDQYTASASKADAEFMLNINEFRSKSKLHEEMFDKSLARVQSALAAKAKAA